MFYAEYRGTRIFEQLTGLAVLTKVQFSQNFKGPLAITVRDLDGVAVDMTGWTVSAGIVGGSGEPTGTAGGPVLAAYTAGLSYDTPTKVFSGTLDCNTTEMADLISTSASRRTKFAVKFVKNDATERFEVSVDCAALAADIETGSASPTALGPVSFTVDEGQPQETFAFPNCPANADLQFIKLSGGPAVDFYVVNFNEDDPTQNTVTVTLAGNAAAGGQNFKAYVAVT